MSLSSKILITTEKGDEIIVYLRSSKAPLNAARLLRMLPLHTRIYFTHDRKIAYFTLTKRLTLEKPSRKIPRGSLFYWVQRNVLAFSLEDTVVQGYACIV
ncbi:MAG: hypothetical protein J7L38_00075, partial [Thermoproteales archaeon]|nr:hypothetical protein [Thermoproteales archaeon]